MSEETHLDKRQVVCPLSLMLGYVQNYRVSERPNKGCLESRPTSGTDAFAENFFKVLHAPKGEEVEVEITGMIPESGYVSITTDGAEPGQIGTYIKTLKGLGQGPGTEAGGDKGAQALKFPQKAGLQARERAVQMINAGEIRAPKKNWDKTFGPEQTVTFTDADGETTTFQIGGGTKLDELKEKYPELYNQRRKKTEKPEKEIAAKTDDDFDDDFDDEDDDDYERAPKMETAIADEELEAIADEVGDGEAAFSEEEETYAVAATADIEHEHTMTVVIDRPDKVTTVTTNAMVVVGPDGNDQTYYMVVHPATGEHVWVKEGDNSCPHCGFAVEVR